VLTVLRARELRLLWPGSRQASSREALVLVAAGLHVTRLTGNPAAAHTGEDVETCLNGSGEEAVWVTSRGVCYRGRDALGGYRSGGRHRGRT
jgi:hypothetical protein